MPTKKRKVFEKGHLRKFLIVVDDSPEFDVALAFAARVADRTGGGLSLAYVIQPADFHHWLGVEEVRREEEMGKAKALFRLARRRLARVGCEDIPLEEIVREGDKAEEILALIEEDEDIAILVLGAAANSEGPGPLVSSLAAGSGAGTFPIPIYVVPGSLEVDDILALA